MTFIMLALLMVLILKYLLTSEEARAFARLDLCLVVCLTKFDKWLIRNIGDLT
jgi:hypothetical protein